MRVVIRDVSPIIVRRIDVPGSVSLPMLHDVLLACFDWTGECLHEFDIRGRCYSHVAFVSAESSLQVTIESLGLRLGERLEWRYDFVAGWVIDARVEGFVDVDTPTVVSGRRRGPLEWVSGPAAFAAWEESFTWVEFYEIADQLVDVIRDRPPEDVELLHERLLRMERWVHRNGFDLARTRRAVHDVSDRWAHREGSSCESSSTSASTQMKVAKAVN